MSPFTALLAHVGAPLAPHDLPGAWPSDPGVWALLAALAVPYAIGLARLQRRVHHGAATWRRRAWLYAAGWLTLAVALASPLHTLGGALFSAHMVQHELLIAVAAPLLVLGTPGAAFAWALPAAWRRPLGTLGRRVVPHDPWLATLLHAVALWAWHAPALYTLSLHSELAHAAQHGAFLGTGWLLWHAVLGRHARRRPAAGVAALFLTTLHSGALGALLAISTHPWIGDYATTTMAWGLTPLEDQQLAGLVMWVPGGITYIVAALWLMAGVLRARPAGEPVLVTRG